MPPPELSHAQFADYCEDQVLRLNHIDDSCEALSTTLTTGSDPILRAAAAHSLGAHRLEAGVPPLREAHGVPNELVNVEAAYALVVAALGP